MSPRKDLARGLLLLFVSVSILALPVFLSAGGTGAAPSRPSLASATGTPGDPFVAKLARLREIPARQAATNIVISEFRTRGPAAEPDEFIELFNPTAGTVSLENWSLWRSDSCAPSEGLVYTFGLGASLTAGQHLLIGGLLYGGSTDIGPIDIGVADDGGLALRSGPLVTDPVVDRVGLCADGLFEGAPLAPLISDTDQSYDRDIESSGICTDSNNNAADFFQRSPSDPQSSGTVLAVCGNPTLTPTASNTPTATATVDCAVAPTPTFYPSRAVMINEVAWSGTLASSADEWVELYSTYSCPISLAGWHLIGIRSGGQTAFDVSFTAAHIIPAGDFFIIATKSGIFTSGATIDLIPATTVKFGFIDSGLTLYLFDPGGERVDTANLGSGVVSSWPAGSTSGRRSMERYRNSPDARTNWVTFARTPLTGTWPRDRNGNFVNGSPGLPNWSLSVTITPSPIPTKVRTPTPRPPTPFAHMVINEFLPRAGTDWNGDGAVNVYDEFIELKNLGPIDVDLKGWKLDDEANQGSPMYTLPSIKLKPGERTVLYSLTTGVRLEDSGDTVRLINPQGIVIDARGYGVIERVDESHCRIPDGYYWRRECFATPGNENALTGEAPEPVAIEIGARPPCLLPDIIPDPFRQAECEGYGDDMWDRDYWDRQAGWDTFPIDNPRSKWRTSVQ